MLNKEAACDGLTMEQSATQMVSFYADNDVLSARDPVWLQGTFNILIDLFKHVGLKINTKKMQVLTCVPGKIRESMSKEVHHDSRLGQTLSTKRKRLQVDCNICSERLQASSLQSHLKPSTTSTACLFSIRNLQWRYQLPFMPASTQPPVSTTAWYPVVLVQQIRVSIHGITL
jgi:hypothetical protein